MQAPARMYCQTTYPLKPAWILNAPPSIASMLNCFSLFILRSVLPFVSHCSIRFATFFSNGFPFLIIVFNCFDVYLSNVCSSSFSFDMFMSSLMSFAFGVVFAPFISITINRIRLGSIYTFLFRIRFKGFFRGEVV